MKEVKKVEDVKKELKKEDYEIIVDTILTDTFVRIDSIVKDIGWTMEEITNTKADYKKEMMLLTLERLRNRIGTTSLKLGQIIEIRKLQVKKEIEIPKQEGKKDAV